MPPPSPMDKQRADWPCCSQKALLHDFYSVKTYTLCHVQFCFILLVISPPFLTLHYLWQLLGLMVIDSDKIQFSEADKAHLASYYFASVSPVNSTYCHNWASQANHTPEKARKKSKVSVFFTVLCFFLIPEYNSYSGH